MHPAGLEAVEIHMLSLGKDKKTHPKTTTTKEKTNTGPQTDLQLYKNKLSEAK